MAGQTLEGNVPPAHVSALCRLPSDATHSAHYNKAVVCRLDPCNREIRFCLCIRSSCKGAKRS